MVQWPKQIIESAQEPILKSSFLKNSALANTLFDIKTLAAFGLFVV